MPNKSNLLQIYLDFIIILFIVCQTEQILWTQTMTQDYQIT